MEKAKHLRLGTSRQQGGVWGRNDGVLETCAEFSPIPLPRKAPENQEEEEERAELNQPEEPEAAESSAAGP